MPDAERSSRLALPYLLPAQAQKHVTHNEALQILDAVVQLRVTAFDALTPPSGPAEGEVHALGAAPGGAWSGQGGKLAVWQAGGWVFVTPATGWLGCDAAGEGIRLYRAGQWQPLLHNLAGLGIGTTPDATNRLAVAADATLLSHDGAGHQLKINKAAAGQTASLLFQSGWSGRAEIGLAGADDLSVKVSADGATFVTALTVPAATGRPSLPQGAEIAGQVTGSAVTQSTADTTAGRLLTVGAGAAQLDATLYRQGNILGTVSRVSGVPAGAILERGSNANGTYLRLTCGTQICVRRVQLDGVSVSTAMGSLYRGNVGSFDFPAAFVAVDAVSATLMGSQNAVIRNSAGFLKTRQGSNVNDADWTGVTLWSPSSITGTAGEITHMSLFAIGRWI